MGIARIAGISLVLLGACAKAGDDPATVDGPPSGDGGHDSGGDSAACPPDQFVTDVGETGLVTCAPVDDPTKQAIDSNCSVYLGSRDGCDACTTAPAKWGRASTLSCTNGLGADNRCTTPSLGGDTIQAFGLNLDGDVDGNDKIYGTYHCAAVPPSSGGATPCKAGEFVTGTYGSSWTCAPIATAVIDYVRASCFLYLGWQDGCDGCTTAPVKWGRSGDASCLNGAGADSTCQTATLGTETMNLFGINTDGDVDENDKLHIALQCAPAPPAQGTGTTSCPAGQFMTGINTDGSFQCESPAPLVAKFFADHCQAYYGWQDNCDSCTTPPSKWGKFGTASCSNGLGANGTCSDFTLGGTATSMFGLNPGGDVDGNDTLYVGFQCKL